MSDIVKLKRQPNFTADEVEVLVKGVEKSGKVLLGRFSGVVSAAAKSKGWDELAKEMTAVSGILRSGQEVQKKWTCMKSGAKAAAVEQKKESKATGGGNGSGVTTSGSQQRILDVIGKVAVEGVPGGFDSAATPEQTSQALKDDVTQSAVVIDKGLLEQSSSMLFEADADGHKNMPSAAMDNAVICHRESGVPKKVAKRAAEEQLISLQQQTLDAVNSLVDVQRQLLEVQREMVLIKRAKLASKGWVQDENGNWVGYVVKSSGEE